MCEVFVLLADHTSFDIFGYPSPHSCPPIGLIYHLEANIPPWVSCHWMVMILFEDISFGAIFAYADSSGHFLHDFFC